MSMEEVLESTLLADRGDLSGMRRKETAEVRGEGALVGFGKGSRYIYDR